MLLLSAFKVTCLQSALELGINSCWSFCKGATEPLTFWAKVHVMHFELVLASVCFSNLVCLRHRESVSKGWGMSKREITFQKQEEQCEVSVLYFRRGVNVL